MRKNFPKNRPLVIGLTGSIGMGKSTAARLLKSFGLSVHNADRAVHDALKKRGKAVDPVAKLFPQTLKRGAIDRRLLGQIVFQKPAKLRRLEKTLHPFVLESERQFIIVAHRQKKQAVVLEIPLLYETHAEKRVDVVICVSAPRATQKERVLKRPGMTAAKFRAILKRQMSDKEKRRRADFVVTTGKDTANTKRQLAVIWQKLLIEST